MYNIVELFSGIGSQAKALNNLGYKGDLLATSEWDIHALVAYNLMHNGSKMPSYIKKMNKEELLNELKNYTFSNTGKSPLEFRNLSSYSLIALQNIYWSIVNNHNLVDVSKISGKEMPSEIDIMTYSFPCQDLSNVGAFHGYNKGIDKDSGSRSSLLWQVGRILSEMKTAKKSLPRFLLMENVQTLISPRHKANFMTWIEDLNNLGYESKYFLLNASSFGLPQNRPRLLMISVYVGEDTTKRKFVQQYFKTKNEEEVINDYRKSKYFHQYKIKDFLRMDYDNPKYFNEAVECTPNDTISRKKIWQENPQLVLKNNVINQEFDMVRTITTKQDRHPNSGNLYFNPKEFDSKINGKSKFRYLTPRECLLFMGFTDSDYDVLIKNNFEFHKGDNMFTRDKIIRMAGNSIPVKLLEGVFLQIIILDEILKDLEKHPYLSLDYNTNSLLSDEIKKQLFRHGLRTRVPNGYAPINANLLYPKYKAAIYINDPFWHKHRKMDKVFSEKQMENNIVNQIIERDELIYKDANDKGWKVIIVMADDKPTNADSDLIHTLIQYITTSEAPCKNKKIIK